MKTLKFLGLMVGYFVCKILPIAVLVLVFAYLMVAGFIYGDVSFKIVLQDILQNGLI